MAKPVHILLIEDSQGDAELTRLALQEGAFQVDLVTGLPGFAQLVASLQSFWLGTAKLPCDGS